MVEFQHLKLASQTYVEHLSDAWSYALESMLAAIYFTIHGIIPDLFEHHGSDTLMRLHDKVSVKRRALQDNIQSHDDDGGVN
jgi:hypothetical protein